MFIVLNDVYTDKHAGKHQSTITIRQIVVAVTSLKCLDNHLILAMVTKLVDHKSRYLKVSTLFSRQE